VLFKYRPEQPLVERLRFLTDVLPAKEGSEQRVALRVAPRQEFDVTLSLEKIDRRLLDNILFGQKAASFDIPLWAEPQYLANPGNPASTAVVMQAPTTYWSLRTGDSVLFYYDDTKFEVVTNVHQLGDNLHFDDTPLVNSYPVGTELYILRPATIAKDATVRRYPINLSNYSLTFQITDNNLTLDVPSTFETFAGKYILTDANGIEGSLQENINQQLYIADGDTGVVAPASLWDRSRKVSAKLFKTSSRAAAWEVRKFLYTMRGRQVSFFLPTFNEDFDPASAITAAGTTIDVVNVGYTANVNARTPRNVIRLVTTAGVSYTKTIASAAVISPTVERLTVSSAWGADVAQADIARIDLVEKVRMDSDDVTISHLDSNGQATIGFPVRSVIE
jgi:hypothetical protein